MKSIKEKLTERQLEDRKRIADALVKHIGEAKDYIAFTWIAMHFSREDIEEAAEITLGKEKTDGFTHGRAQYFMGIMRKKALQQGIPWFPKKNRY